MQRETGADHSSNNLVPGSTGVMVQKRGVAAAATSTAETELQQPQVPKKKRRKIIPKPKTIYTRMEKKMKSVKQKKYQSRYGAKNHAHDVYKMMKSFIVDHCLKNERIVESNPLLAAEMATAVFQAFYDHWQVMVAPGSESQEFRQVLDAYATVLQAARPLQSLEERNTVVSLLESIEACVSGYCLHTRSEFDAVVYYTTGDGRTADYAHEYSGSGGPRYKGENVIEQTIRAVMPDYDKATREAKKGKLLNSEISSIAWMNGITLPDDHPAA